MRLIKEGKIRKDKPLSEVSEDEIPFDIPANWCWARLGAISFDHGQKRPDREFTYIDISSIDNENNRLGSIISILKPEEAPSRARKIVQEGDIIYSTVRPYLRNICMIDWAINLELIVSTGFVVICMPNSIMNRYSYRYLLSPMFDSYINDNENTKGVVYPAINDDKSSKALLQVVSRIFRTFRNRLASGSQLTSMSSRTPSGL